MSNTNFFRTVRLESKETVYLDRQTANSGDIAYDKQEKTLRLYDGSTKGGFAIARADLDNITVDTYRSKSIESKLSTVIYSVTVTGPVGLDVGNKYNLNGNYYPTPNFVVGYTYVFVQDNQTNVYYPNSNGTTLNPHPLNFSSDNANGINGGGTSYLNEVKYLLNDIEVTQAVYNSNAFNTATTRRVQITVTNATPPTLYYWCWNHSNMGNQISVADPGSGVVTTQNVFSTVAVAGFSELLVADSDSDTLTFAAGTGMSLISDTDTDTLTITNTGILSVVAGANITVSSVDGVVTVNATATPTGNIIFDANTVTSTDSSAITFTPLVNFGSDVVVGNELVFSDGTRQVTAPVLIPGPQGEPGPAGATGAGTGDVVSSGDTFTNNALVRYDGITGTIIKNSPATLSDGGLLTTTNFSGGGSNLFDLNADQLSSGTIPDSRFPATLPTSSGANLTALNATQLTSGTVPVLRIGASGTRDATTYLRGDNTWATIEGGSGTASDSFSTIVVAGQSNVVADSATDSLTLVAGDGITITTSATTDTITITSTVSGGVTAFTDLTDAAGNTVDKFYMPAITMLTVTNSGATAYRFDQYGVSDDPTIYAINGTTIAFNLNVTGHPFLIQDGTGTNYSNGLTHVTPAGVVTTGADAQGQVSGTLYWKVPSIISGNYRYQCSIHAAMVGTITIKNFLSI